MAEKSTDRSDLLGINDLSEVIELLRKHGYAGTSYHELGLFLGLSDATLKNIEHDYKQASRRLSECLAAWLRRVDKVDSKGGPTWVTLRDAMRKLGENAVADGIERDNTTTAVSLKLNEIELVCSPPQGGKQLDNESWKQFRRHLHTLSLNATITDAFIKAAHEKYLIGLAERKIAEGLTDHDIKLKTIMNAVGSMISNSRYHERMLQVAIDTLESVKKDHSDDAVRAPIDMKELKEDKQETATGAEIPITSEYDEYSEYLRLIYNRQKPRAPDVIRKGPTPDFIEPHLVESYTSNNLVLSDLLSSGESRIIIEGPPGSGKSYLAHEIRRQWIEKEALCQYPLFLFIQLKDKNNHIDDQDKCQAERKLLKTSLTSQSWKERTIQKIIDTSGRGVFILLEGYNELPEKLQNDSVYAHLIEGHILPAATVLVTSQPLRALGEIKSSCTSILVATIKGLNKEGIVKFLKKIRLKLDMFPPQIQACFYSPILLRLVTFNMTFQTNDTYPNTSTQVYQQLVEKLTSTHSKNDASDNEEALLRLGKLAWHGIRKNEFIFPCDQTKSLGLMESFESDKPDVAIQIQQKFLHQTVQEYLAAYYISTQKDDDAVIKEVFEKCKGNPCFTGTLMFLAGLLKSPMLPNFISTVPSSPEKISNFTIFHQLHEAGSGVDNMDEITVATTFPSPSPHDMLALGYCISNSHTKWRLGFTLRSLTVEHAQALYNGMGHSPNGKIITFNFSLNNLGNKGVETLLTLSSDATVIINIRGNGLDKDFKLPPLPENVELFFIHDNQFFAGEQESIVTAVCAHPRIQEVCFSNLSPNESERLLTSRSFITKVELYQLQSDSISMVMRSLKVSGIHTLRIEQSKIERNHVAQLRFHRHSPLMKLELVNCAITTDTLQYLVDALDYSQIVHLDLKDNLIDDDVMKFIRRIYRWRLTCFFLNGNPFKIQNNIEKFNKHVTCRCKRK